MYAPSFKVILYSFASVTLICITKISIWQHLPDIIIQKKDYRLYLTVSYYRIWLSSYKMGLVQAGDVEVLGCGSIYMEDFVERRGEREAFGLLAVVGQDPVRRGPEILAVVDDLLPVAVGREA